MTLNSVDWEENILIRNKNSTKVIKIGEFIDNLMEDNNDVEHLGDNKKEEMGDTYYLDTTDKEYYIPSVDKIGKVSWKKIEAITKHLPMNKDGTNTLVKIKTRLGREVTATKAKSFLTRVDDEIVPIRGDKIKVGTYVPIMKDFPKTNYSEYLDLVKYFPKNKYSYGSEIKKAQQYKTYCNENGIKNWFSVGKKEKKFIVCQTLSSLNRMFNGERKREYLEGYIYPKQCQRTKSLIPEKLKLDNILGFIVGAYVSEGWWHGDTIGIANNDAKYRNLIKKFANKYNIGYYERCRDTNQLSNTPSYTIELHSILLATLLLKSCGKLAPNKRIPDFAYNAPDEFLNGFFNGYFSGDGTVCKQLHGRNISCTSVSKKLITGLSTLLTRFGIISKISTRSQRKKCLLPSTKLEDLKKQYILTIRNENIKLFFNNIKLVIDYKNENVKYLSNIKFKNDGGMFDKVPGVDIQSDMISRIKKRHNKTSDTYEDLENNIIHMTDIKYLIENHKDDISKEDMKALKQIINSNVYYDQIVSIEEVKPTHKYVYDLTVEDTKNFILANGLSMRDSFHHSGIASMSATVQGVPRMKELLSVSKKPKTPQMVIYLTEEFMNSKDMAHKIASHIKHTTLGDIRGRINVYFDPKPSEKGSIMEKDNVKHVFFHHKGSRTNCQSDITGLPWLLRIELDREKMLEKEVNLLEIKSKFCSWWEKRYADTKAMKKEEKKVINKITQLAVLSNSDNDKQPILHIRFNVKDADKEKDRFDFSTIDNFIDFIIDKFKLKGINSVTDIPAIQEERILTFNPESGNIDKNTQHVIYTTGVNLEEIRYLVGVDLQRTISNHVMEVYETFGIEMARAVLLREIANAYERAGGEVNYQHITMIVDQMTATGAINSVDRHGMNKSDSDPLSRASFEKTVEQLLIAAVYGETDYMRGVSSRIMAGAVIKGGTGYCELELDTDMIEKSEYIEGIDYTKKFTELNKGTLAGDVIGKKNDDIFIPM